MNSDSGSSDEPDRTAGEPARDDLIASDSTDTTSSSAGRSADESDRRGGTGESIGRALDSAGETLTQPGPRSQLTFVIGLFAVIGVGFGLTGIIVVEMIAGSGDDIGTQILTAVFLVALLVVLLLAGSIIGAFSGLRIADRLDETARTVYLTSFVATAVGHFVMVVIAVVLIGLVTGGGGGGAGGGGSLFDVLDLVIPLVVLAVVVGLTGLGASFLVRRPTTREPPAR